MLDIFCKDKSLKAGWISRLSNNNSVNSCFLNMYLSKFGIDINYLIKSSVNDQCLYIKHLKLPKFWAEVFAYVNQCKTQKELKKSSDNEFLLQPIWLNHHFTDHKNKPIFISNWVKCGILFVKDIFPNGTFITEQQLLQKLTHKQNWMVEYLKVKNIFTDVEHSTINANYVERCFQRSLFLMIQTGHETPHIL